MGQKVHPDIRWGGDSLNDGLVLLIQNLKAQESLHLACNSGALKAILDLCILCKVNACVQARSVQTSGAQAEGAERQRNPLLEGLQLGTGNPLR